MVFWSTAGCALVAVVGLHSVDAWIPASSGLATTAPVRSTQLFMAGPPILDKWKILRSGAVMGVVKNHPDKDLNDGDTITTSPLRDPTSVAEKKIVVTESGSKYRLGAPLIKPKPKAKANGAVAAKKSKTDMWADIKKEYRLTGETIGGYLLSGSPMRSTSGKSQIWTAYKPDKQGNPTGDALKIKVSNDQEKLKQEAANYRRVSSAKFVKSYQFLSRAGDSGKFASQAALVIESGGINLRELIDKRRKPLAGKALRDTAVAAIECIGAIHGSRLVWTDMKPENFVVCSDPDDLGKGITVKGIDLESAIPVKGNPIDYSPEATPPEFAQALLAGEGPYFVLDYSYDIWSFGILLFEISTGRSAFQGKSQSQITKVLSNEGFEVDLSPVTDQKLRDLISQCLQINPKRRPSTTQILLHPYFLTTGIAGFSF